MRNKEEILCESAEHQAAIDLINFEFESDIGPEYKYPEGFKEMDLEYDL